MWKRAGHTEVEIAWEPFSSVLFMEKTLEEARVNNKPNRLERISFPGSPLTFYLLVDKGHGTGHVILVMVTWEKTEDQQDQQRAEIVYNNCADVGCFRQTIALQEM